MDGDVRRQIIEEDLPILTSGIGFGAFQSMSQFGEGNDRYDHFRSSMYSEKLSEKLPNRLSTALGRHQYVGVQDQSH